MAAKKIRDLAVKTGTYEMNGETKGRYENVGSMMKGDDGGVFLIMKRTFNPAGVANPENRDSLMVSCFEVSEKGQGQQQQQQTQQQQPSQDDDTDLPF